MLAFEEDGRTEDGGRGNRLRFSGPRLGEIFDLAARVRRRWLAGAVFLCGFSRSIRTGFDCLRSMVLVAAAEAAKGCECSGVGRRVRRG